MSRQVYGESISQQRAKKGTGRLRNVRCFMSNCSKIDVYHQLTPVRVETGVLCLSKRTVFDTPHLHSEMGKTPQLQLQIVQHL